MADFIDNFNFDPADNKETSVSYTVPGGMYAIMDVTLSVSAMGHVTAFVQPSQNTVGFTTSDSDSLSMQLRLKEGSVVTKVETAASASSSATPFTSVTSTSTAQLLVDGTVVGTIRCQASASLATTSADPRTLEISGTSDVDWHISEYNKQGA